MQPIRADKLVSEALGVTRQEARRLIQKRKVKINGVQCCRPDEKAESESQVEVAGQAVQHREYVYIMLNKPKGVVSASADPRCETVVDLVRGQYPRRALFPAGRLDKDSEGFVLLTDDGIFARNILAPKRHVPKTYCVTLDTPFTAEMAKGFALGVTLASGEVTLSAAAEETQNPFVCKVVLHQGLYHQIKRMFGRFGAGVNALRRTAIGPVELDAGLPAGGYRELTEEELAKITGACS